MPRKRVAPLQKRTASKTTVSRGSSRTSTRSTKKASKLSWIILLVILAVIFLFIRSMKPASTEPTSDLAPVSTYQPTN